jgi:hypothetical protein
MDAVGKDQREWQEHNPLLIWRMEQGLSRRQAAEEFGMTDRRLLELELGFAPLDVEWDAITPRTGISRERWAAWERDQPHFSTG